jgi:hypothetical protein
MIIIALVVLVLIGILVGMICALAPNKVPSSFLSPLLLR